MSVVVPYSRALDERRTRIAALISDVWFLVPEEHRGDALILLRRQAVEIDCLMAETYAWGTAALARRLGRWLRHACLIIAQPWRLWTARTPEI